MSELPASFWVLGTDTEVGKTHVASLLALYYQNKGARLKVTKPVATGAVDIEGELICSDTEALRSAVANQQTAQEITPWVFREPLSPWTASQSDGATLKAGEIADYVTSLSTPPGRVIAEGLGGVHVPLNATETFLDVVKKTQWPVVFVVGLRLGCINHTLLSLEALTQRQIPLVSLIVNEFQQGTETRVKESSLQEISSRFESTTFLSYQASFPMALSQLDNIAKSFCWP